MTILKYDEKSRVIFLTGKMMYTYIYISTNYKIIHISIPILVTLLNLSEILPISLLKLCKINEYVKLIICKNISMNVNSQYNSDNKTTIICCFFILLYIYLFIIVMQKEKQFFQYNRE